MAVVNDSALPGIRWVDPPTRLPASQRHFGLMHLGAAVESWPKASSMSPVTALDTLGDEKLPKAPEGAAHSTDVSLGHVTGGHFSAFR